MTTKMVLTGGPCSGKSTVLAALKEAFDESVVIVPEVATVLLQGGFPLPGRDLEWSEQWQSTFQGAVLPLQQSFEESHAIIAAQRNCKLIICDRGILDGAAYTLGGTKEFCRKYGMDEVAVHERYDAVIHLESLATGAPEKFGKTNNDVRFESLERAQELEHTTRAAWQGHPRRHIVGCADGIEQKIVDTIGIIRKLLDE